MNKKPWDEKLGIWVGIIAGIFGILGISIFGGRALVKYYSEKPDKNIQTNIKGDNNTVNNTINNTVNNNVDNIVNTVVNKNSNEFKETNNANDIIKN